MAKVGFIGVGDMGSGMARNILKAGHALSVFDLRAEQLEPLVAEGATAAGSPKEVGENSDFVFIMVMNGDQAKAIVSGKDGLLEGMKPGSVFICSATIFRSELEEAVAPLLKAGIEVVDSPVSGGAPGAAAGTLTMMVAARKDVFEKTLPVLQAVGENIVHVGEEIGLGQTVKASLAVLVGVTYAGVFETLALGVKAGVTPEILLKVIGTSSAGSPIFRDTTKNIMERNFTGQSSIVTMHKDLGIARGLARQYGVPLFTASTAAEWFQAGITLNPEESNWSIIKILEGILGIEVKATE
jgi:putative dehydrogenase